MQLYLELNLGHSRSSAVIGRFEVPWETWSRSLMWKRQKYYVCIIVHNKWSLEKYSTYCLDTWIRCSPHAQKCTSFDEKSSRVIIDLWTDFLIHYLCRYKKVLSVVLCPSREFMVNPNTSVHSCKWYVNTWLTLYSINYSNSTSDKLRDVYHSIHYNASATAFIYFSLQSSSVRLQPYEKNKMPVRNLQDCGDNSDIEVKLNICNISSL